MLRSISLLFLIVFSAATPAFLSVQEKQKSSQEKGKIVIPADDENAIARRDFMRTKLLFSQNIFHGLTTGDFDMIKSSIKDVSEITEGEAWVAIDNDQYRKLTEDFKTTVKRLSEAADSENLEATALRYYNMSTSCIDCHQHIRKANYVF